MGLGEGPNTHSSGFNGRILATRFAPMGLGVRKLGPKHNLSFVGLVGSRSFDNFVKR